ILEILGNPAYAGAFVYGRTGARPERRPGEPGRVKRRRPEDWAVVHRDAYPAYISWEEYLANQARLADNASRYDLRALRAPDAHCLQEQPALLLPRHVPALRRPLLPERPRAERGRGGGRGLL